MPATVVQPLLAAQMPLKALISLLTASYSHHLKGKKPAQFTGLYFKAALSNDSVYAAASTTAVLPQAVGRKGAPKFGSSNQS